MPKRNRVYGMCSVQGEIVKNSFRVNDVSANFIFLTFVTLIINLPLSITAMSEQTKAAPIYINFEDTPNQCVLQDPYAYSQGVIVKGSNSYGVCDASEFIDPAIVAAANIDGKAMLGLASLPYEPYFGDYSGVRISFIPWMNPSLAHVTRVTFMVSAVYRNYIKYDIDPATGFDFGVLHVTASGASSQDIASADRLMVTVDALPGQSITSIHVDSTPSYPGDDSIGMIFFDNLTVYTDSPFDLWDSAPIVNQPNAIVSPIDGLLHVAQGIPTQINVPISGSSFNSPETRSTTVTLQAGTQKLSQIVSLASIQSAGTLMVPFKVTFGPQDTGLQTITATIDPENDLNESNFGNNTASAQVTVDSLVLNASLVGVGVKDKTPVVANSHIGAQIPLGSQFTLAMSNPSVSASGVQATFILTSNSTNSPAPDPDQYKLGGSVLHSLKTPLYNGQSVLGLGIGPASAPIAQAEAAFVAVHTGTATISIKPVDQSLPSSIVTVNVVAPKRLGDTSTAPGDFDHYFIQEGDKQGIPPQYLKAIVAQESSFKPDAFRYEATSWDAGQLDGAALDPSYADYIILHGAHKQDNRQDLIAADLTPRSQYKFVFDLKSPSQTRFLSNSDQGVTIGQIIAANLSSKGKPKFGWKVNEDDIAGGPSAILNDPDYASLAQTPVASSWGLMQPLYVAFASKTDYNWIDASLGRLHQPSDLMDPATNVQIGTKWLLWKINSVNDTDFADPQYETSKEFTDDFWNGIYYYNGYKKGNTSYPDQVMGRVPNYLPMPSASTIFYK